MIRTYDDNYIIGLYFDRDERAIAATQDRYGVYCHKIAVNILGDSGYAEEVVSDAMLGMWNSIPPNRPTNVTAYIGKITRNIAINRYNADHTQKRIANVLALPLDELDNCLPNTKPIESGDLSKLINEFLSNLDKPQRVMFVCRYFFCDKVEEISQKLNVTDSKVKTTLHRLRNKLKKYLERNR